MNPMNIVGLLRWILSYVPKGMLTPLGVVIMVLLALYIGADSIGETSGLWDWPDAPTAEILGLIGGAVAAVFGLERRVQYKIEAAKKDIASRAAGGK